MAVYAYRLVEVEFGFSILLLLLGDVTKAPPGVIVALVGLQCFLVAFLGLLKVFIVHIFVSAECMRVAEEDI